MRLRQMEVYRFQSKAARRYHDLKRMNELQEQYLYLVNHKIESADEMLEHHAQIEEKIADISAEQKMIYAENRKLGRYSEDEAETMRQIRYTLLYRNRHGRRKERTQNTRKGWMNYWQSFTLMRKHARKKSEKNW